MDKDTQLKQATEFIYLCLAKRNDLSGSIYYSDDDDWEVEMATEDCRVGYFPEDNTALFSHVDRSVGSGSFESIFEEGTVKYLAEKTYEWLGKYQPE